MSAGSPIPPRRNPSVAADLFPGGISRLISNAHYDSMYSLLLTALFFPVWLNSQVGLRDGPWIENTIRYFSFEGRIHFIARVYSSESILESRLVVEYDSSRYVFSPQQASLYGGYSLAVDVDRVPRLPFPFTFIKYWWEVDFPSGFTLTSPPQAFQFSDPKYSWDQLNYGRVTVGWAEVGSEAATDAAELALLAVGTISADLESPIPERITLILYPKLADFHAAMGDRIRGWEGAVSSPVAGIIILASAPGAEGRKTLAVLISHEMTHILLGAKWGSAYASLPLWLVEGAAAGYEMEPRPEADQTLQDAVGNGRLIPIPTLCGVFPSNEGSAFLAYAESKSFVAFLKEKYGLAALRQAFAAYAGGAECNRGWEASTGKSLSELESDWISRFAHEKPWIPSAWVLVLAGLVLLAGMLIVQMLIHHRKLRLPAGKEGTG